MLLFEIENAHKKHDATRAEMLKSEASYTCASIEGSDQTHFKDYTIIKPEQGEEEIVEKALILKNQVLCRAYGLPLTEQDVVPQTVIVRCPNGRMISVTQSQFGYC